MDRFELEAAYARTLLPSARLWRLAADRALSGMGVSASSGWALLQVGRLGDDVRQIDLARQLDVTGASLVRTLDQMVAAGLVDRHPDELDRRVSRIRLTEKGRTLAAAIEEVFGRLRHESLDGVSDADLRSAIVVARHLEAYLARGRGGQ